MKRRRRQQRHAFRFKVGSEGKIITCWATVVEAKRDVFLPLKVEHVREFIRLNGVGNTQTCSMAVCAKHNADCFPHKVEGYIDWFDSRAFVVSRLNKNGLPSACYAYAHSDGIGRTNDTAGGQRKLLDELEKAGGERVIHLRPIRRIPTHKIPRSGRRDGSRTKAKTQTQVRGAKLRFAVAALGGVPAN